MRDFQSIKKSNQKINSGRQIYFKVRSGINKNYKDFTYVC
jgi:hypothetical protein